MGGKPSETDQYIRSVYVTSDFGTSQVAGLLYYIWLQRSAIDLFSEEIQWKACICMRWSDEYVVIRNIDIPVRQNILA